MTTICLNEMAITQNSLCLGEVLLMLSIFNKADLKKAEIGLIEKGFITADRDEYRQPIGWKLTNEGSTVLDSVILDSSKEQEPQDRLVSLAQQMKAIFPKGKKAGTSYYWADGLALIVRRLKLFFKKYGNEYTDEQIIQATKKYVEGFNGNYTYMRLLKYFIFKEKVGASGEVEGDSELISYIENAGQTDDLRSDWTTQLS
jgi:hypothetical protein|nr:MAG TPA: hypothetical protein [Crassvirales sp.]